MPETRIDILKDRWQYVREMIIGVQRATPIGDRTERVRLWNDCWANSNASPYFGQVVRIGDDFDPTPGLERRLFKELRSRVYAQYLDGVSEVSEFGCGLGENLLAVPGRRRLRGFDWSLNALAKCGEKGIEAHAFDMFFPSESVELTGAVLTVHALEQLGKDWQAFLNYLRAQPVEVCIHIEPIVELYDEENALDYLSSLYHRKRGYLEGFLPALQRLAAQKQIELIEVTKSPFGGLHHLAYCVIVWRPR